MRDSPEVTLVDAGLAGSLLAILLATRAPRDAPRAPSGYQRDGGDSFCGPLAATLWIPYLPYA
jgi:hypothetical protein